MYHSKPVKMWGKHGLRTPREEIAFTARPKTQSQSQIFRYGRSIFCLPHLPNFSDIFDLILHWVSVVRGQAHFFNTCYNKVALSDTSGFAVMSLLIWAVLFEYFLQWPHGCKWIYFRSKEVAKSGFEIPNSCAHENKNATLKKIFPHREALAESVGFKSRMMSFDKVKTFTNNLGPLFGHDAINRKAVRLRAIERKYKNSRYLF